MRHNTLIAVIAVLAASLASAQQTTTPQAPPPPTAEDPLKSLTPEQAEALKQILVQQQAVVAQQKTTQNAAVASMKPAATPPKGCVAVVPGKPAITGHVPAWLQRAINKAAAKAAKNTGAVIDTTAPETILVGAQTGKPCTPTAK